MQNIVSGVIAIIAIQVSPLRNIKFVFSRPIENFEWNCSRRRAKQLFREIDCFVCFEANFFAIFHQSDDNYIVVLLSDCVNIVRLPRVFHFPTGVRRRSRRYRAPTCFLIYRFIDPPTRQLEEILLPFSIYFAQVSERLKTRAGGFLYSNYGAGADKVRE